MSENGIWAIAHNVSKISNCKDRQVGCVIFNKNTQLVVGIGYNTHPDGICDCDTTKTAQHAEVMAIKNLEGENLKEDLIAYVSHKPCCGCASELDAVVFEVRYRSQK